MYLVEKHVFGPQFFGLFVSLVLGSRYLCLLLAILEFAIGFSLSVIVYELELFVLMLRGIQPEIRELV